MKKYLLSVGLLSAAGITALYSCSEPKIIPTPNNSVKTPESNPVNTSTPYIKDNLHHSETPPKVKKISKSKKSNPKDNSPPETPKNQSTPNLSYTFPRPSTSDLEDDEELPWYNLLPEERNFKTLDQVGTYFNAAIEARDYRVAESYLNNFQEIATPQEYERLRKGLLYIITSNYNEYLNDILEHCDLYESDSVLRKVLWMNFFTNEHPEVFPITDQNTPPLDTAALFKKGITALDSIKYCPEKKHE